MTEVGKLSLIEQGQQALQAEAQAQADKQAKDQESAANSRKHHHRRATEFAEEIGQHKFVTVTVTDNVVQVDIGRKVWAHVQFYTAYATNYDNDGIPSRGCGYDSATTYYLVLIYLTQQKTGI